MNREIIEAIKQIEREKGINSETLLVALEDALLAAPGDAVPRGLVLSGLDAPGMDAVAGAWAGAEPDDAIDTCGFTQGQCERSAHEPAANQAELFESHGLARGADRVRTNHLVKRTHLLQRSQRVGHRRLTDVAIEIDVEIVFPLADRKSVV